MKNIVIKNIDKILGSKIEDRILYKITDYKNSLNEEAYVFHFMELTRGGMGNGWNKEQNVHLVRIPKYNTDRYELFVMGLAGGTVIELELKDIQNYHKVISAISISLGKAHSWWRGQR
jgi:hypothetical protein